MLIKLVLVLAAALSSTTALSCKECSKAEYWECATQDHSALLRTCPMNGLWGLSDELCPCQDCYKKRCANGLLEKCGGPWGIKGTCGNFLRCVKPTDDWGETGVCWLQGLDCQPGAEDKTNQPSPPSHSGDNPVYVPHADNPDVEILAGTKRGKSNLKFSLLSRALAKLLSAKNSKRNHLL